MAVVRKPNIGPFLRRRWHDLRSGPWLMCSRPFPVSAKMRISPGPRRSQGRSVYLLDTNVISEARKGDLANPGVVAFLDRVREENLPVYLSAISIGEIRQAVERIRRRGETESAKKLEAWLTKFSSDYDSRILAFDLECALVWGVLCAVEPARPIDKQVAAIALVHDLTLVTGSASGFSRTGARVLDPFSKLS